VVGSDRERRWGLGRGKTLREILKQAGLAGLDLHIIAPSSGARLGSLAEGAAADGG
jgi:hypothetical protein